MVTVLATASVKCADPNTKLFDESSRRESYLNACTWWLDNSAVSNLVVCENSHDQLLGLLLEETAREKRKHFEYLSFAGDLRMTFALGKGYGEGEIIKHAIQHSSIIANSAYGFYKITGRLKIANFFDISRRIDATSNVFRLMSTRFRRPRMVDTRFFYVQPGFYIANLIDAYRNVNDRAGKYLEHTFYDGLVGKDQLFGMPLYPLLVGRSATTGTDYADSRLEFARKMANLFHLYDL